MKRACKRAWEADALRDGRLSGADAEAFARHATTCADCHTQQELDDRVRHAATRLPAHEADALHARRLRQRILELAGNAPSPRRPWPWLAAVAITALVVTAFGARALMKRAPASVAAAQTAQIEERPFGATVEAESGARWSKERADRTELVHLDDGALVLTVRHREAGERFLVLLPDGEIEVRGTLFRVDIAEGHTREIEVREGIVVLRRPGEIDVALGAGQRWSRPRAVPAAPAPKATSAIAAPAASPRVAAPGSASSGDAIVERYEAAIALFDAHRFDDAARAFRAFVASYPRAEEADDAAFLEGMSLARAGHAAEAGTAADSFLTRYPQSIHSRDAAVLAVRAAIARKDCAHAQSLASRWLPPGALRDAAAGCEE